MALNQNDNGAARNALKAGQKALATGQRALVALPQQTRALIKRIPEPVQLQMRTYSRRSVIVSFEVFIGVLIVAFVAAALVHMRLKEGPISLSFLVGPIERSINREFSGVSVDIEDVVLRKAANSDGIEFRLLNLRMVGERGETLAQAPLAAIALSGRSLLMGSIAPGSVELIGARLNLFYRDDQGLALSFSRPDLVAELLSREQDWAVVKVTRSKERAETVVERRSLSDIETPDAEPQIDLVAAVYDTFERTRRKPGVSTYLRKFGFRDAVLSFDVDGEKSVWRVPDFSLDLEHKKKHSVIWGAAKLQGQERDWNIRFRTEQSGRRKDLIFTVLFDDFVPRDVALRFSELGLFRALDFPLKGQASVTVTRDGDIKGAEADLELASGHLVSNWGETQKHGFDGGNLRVSYRRDSGKIDILPSDVRWGQSRATIEGQILTAPNNSGKNWEFYVGARDAQLAAEDLGVSITPVQEWAARGQISSDFKTLQLEDYRLILPDGGLQFSGSISDAPGSAEIIGEGSVTAASAETLKRLWPAILSPFSRSWVGDNLLKATGVSGRFKLAMAGGVLAEAGKGGDIPNEAGSLDLDFENYSIRYLNTMPPLEGANGVLRMVGRRLFLELPNAVVNLPSGGKVNAELAEFVVDDLRPKTPVGEVRVKAQAPLRHALEFLDYEPVGVIDRSGIKVEKFRGDVTSEFTLKVPMAEDTEFADIDVKGIARIAQIESNKVFGKVSIDGGAIDFGISRKAIDARGDILLNGVPAKISWQRIFGGKDDVQPAIRISGTFDDSARKQLGVPTDRFLKGDVASVLLITRGPDQKKKFRLEANLANARLTIDDVGWTKAPGRPADLGFDIIEDHLGGIELRNFHVHGEKIGISGWLKFNAKGKLVAYEFPEFSYDVISRLELRGDRGKDGIWKVKAKSSTYDGRKFFRSLFSGGGAPDDRSRGRRVRPGVDLEGYFGTVVGHFDSSVHDLSMRLKKRNGRLKSFSSVGKFRNGKVVSAQLDDTNGAPRIITAKSDDAGSAFRLVGFYPKIEGGFATLRVNLDGEGAASKKGTLDVRDFVIVGNQVVYEADPAGTIETARRSGKKRNSVYEKFDFDRMTVPFSVGFGQFVLHDSQINGPLLGATLRGRIDFEKDRMLLGGTYVPLFGINQIPGQIPILGEILRGREGEGLLGVTFAVQGPIAGPEVIVNPVSMAVPGIFRQIFEMSPNQPEVRPRGPAPDVPSRKTGTPRRTPPRANF